MAKYKSKKGDIPQTWLLTGLLVAGLFVAYIFYSVLIQPYYLASMMGAPSQDSATSADGLEMVAAGIGGWKCDSWANVWINQCNSYDKYESQNPRCYTSDTRVRVYNTVSNGSKYAKMSLLQVPTHEYCSDVSLERYKKWWRLGSNHGFDVDINLDSNIDSGGGKKGPIKDSNAVKICAAFADPQKPAPDSGGGKAGPIKDPSMNPLFKGSIINCGGMIHFGRPS